tara:strand:- start:204 stop:518 length:315 start_codon:yes stop_codon:yes gene_type:complete
MSHDGNIELNEKELEQCKEESIEEFKMQMNKKAIEKFNKQMKKEAIAEFKEEISKNFLASMTTQLHSIILTLEGISEQLKIEKELLNSFDNMSSRVTQIYDKVV